MNNPWLFYCRRQKWIITCLFLKERPKVVSFLIPITPNYFWPKKWMGTVV
ncbi:MAG: hypothetical protein MRERV_6c075 [Mycoplasmataceae bacterium RV_VA103A]|nr:MAG: hypothetical protein MRERV_6c075 [Mycoplasmataceae bacterium RV_VA103A]